VFDTDRMGLRRGAGAAAVALAAIALVWLLLSGGGDEQDAGEGTATAGERGALDPAGRGAPDSLEELVEGVMLVGFEGKEAKGALEGLDGHAYGAVLVGPANWAGKEPGTKLVADLREQLGKGDGRAPLIVARQEGGVYRALADLPPELREIEVGDRGEPKLATEWGEETSKTLADAGFDLNLAPVADVAPLSSAIADRAFSDDPGAAARMTVAALEGCEKGGVACAVSHFPGLGSASQDTDQGPAPVGLDQQALATRDLIPFRAAFRAGAPATVISNGLYVAFDPVTPAALTPEIVTGLLRDDLGFDGVAISDDIGAGAIEAVTDPGDAAVEAVAAGVDLVQVADPGDVKRVRAALLAAAEEGELTRERLEEANGRIARLAGGGGGKGG
jgi:beta-N-acetylhexosaminidase